MEYDAIWELNFIEFQPILLLSHVALLVVCMKLFGPRIVMQQIL